jgi:hypothetical protein
MPHYIKGLRLLRDRLNNNSELSKFSSSTAAAVMGLCGYAMVTGDLEYANRHLEGLCKIVKLRGGVGTFVGAEKLLVEILRYTSFPLRL